MHHTDVHTAQHQAIGSFEAEQASANHHSFFILVRRINHRVGVGNVAVGNHAFEVFAGHGQDERVGAGTHQQAVVLHLGAVICTHDALDAVNLHHFFTGMQRDAVVFVPVPAVEHDLVQRLLACQHRAEQNTVVVGVRFCTKNGDVIQLWRNLEQFFKGANTCHAIADHHQFRFFHRGYSESGVVKLSASLVPA